LIDGLWNVPDGTIFRIALSESQFVSATSRWCEEDRMGVEFAEPLERDTSGAAASLAGEFLHEPPIQRIKRRA
jgi:hypothetical protein